MQFIISYEITRAYNWEKPNSFLILLSVLFLSNDEDCTETKCQIKRAAMSCFPISRHMYPIQ